MLPLWFGSIAASTLSLCQRVVSSRASAVGSWPLTYLSNHAVVYQSMRSAPRSDAPNATLGMKLKSKWLPPRMMISPVSTPADVYANDSVVFAVGLGCDVFGVGGRKYSAERPSAGFVIGG